LSRDFINVDRLIWATDFPHQDSEWPHSDELIGSQFAGVPEDDRDKMVRRNVIEYFHLDA